MTVERVENPSLDLVTHVRRGLQEYNAQFVRDGARREIAFFEREGEETIVGGLIGQIQWGWFHVRFLWVDEARRGRGVGGRLMLEAEAESRRQGLQGVRDLRLSSQVVLRQARIRGVRSSSRVSADSLPLLDE